MGERLELRIPNRPSYDLHWVERAMAGIDPALSVSQQSGEKSIVFLLTLPSTAREDLEALRLKAHARLQEISDQRPAFEPPYPSGKPFAHTA
jgi:hypothetical protein